jgi:predicted nuclease of predicted toxin-antitoxin system
VKLLFDENLSRKLVVRLAKLYPNSAHVVEFGLVEHSDREIWEFAKAANFIIVSTDSDFYDLATNIGPPPKVIWLRRWTHPTRDAEEVLRRNAVRITSFAADPEPALLVLDRGLPPCSFGA